MEKIRNFGYGDLSRLRVNQHQATCMSRCLKSVPILSYVAINDYAGRSFWKRPTNRLFHQVATKPTLFIGTWLQWPWMTVVGMSQFDHWLACSKLSMVLGNSTLLGRTYYSMCEYIVLFAVPFTVRPKFVETVWYAGNPVVCWISEHSGPPVHPSRPSAYSWPKDWRPGMTNHFKRITTEWYGSAAGGLSRQHAQSIIIQLDPVCPLPYQLLGRLGHGYLPETTRSLIHSCI